LRSQIASSRNGFDELFKESFDLFFDSLHRYAFTLVKDSEKASDAVQSVFLKWWENQREIEGLNEIKAYLYTAVYRTCLNQLRNEKSRMVISKDYQYRAEKKVSEVEEKMEFEELNVQVQKTIDELPPQCKLIFCKSRFEERKYSEIAIDLNISIKTVEAQMGKALRHLREKLKISLVNQAYHK
jgi:RNA polymerase sigma-70 factor (ECF subfamily)